MVHFTTFAALVVALLSTIVSAVDYVSVNGANFVFNSTGKRFPILGVDYQPGGSSGFTTKGDPLSDPEACLRDAIVMQKAGINTIRVYNLNNNLDHNQCVSIFNAAGIYMIIDVNSGLSGQYIDRSSPQKTYTKDYLQHVFGIVEAFAQFPNLLGFFAANEILNEDSSKDAALYIRAVVRDLKDYINAHAPRHIGVGYSAADVDTMLGDSWNYLGCELANSTSSKIDFFGLNDYEWCGENTFTGSGYNKLISIFAATTIPVFFSEYGCIKVLPRTFQNVPTLYGEQMKVMSGGLVYEYSEEPDNFGLVNINSSKEITLREDFNYLMQMYAGIDYQSQTEVNTTAQKLTAPSCSPSLITESSFPNSWNLPARPDGADDLISKGVTGVSTGSIVSVTATAMPATVHNYTGAEVTGLALVQLGCKDSNYPGLIQHYTASSETCSYATSTGTGKGSGGKDNAAAALSLNVRVLGALLVVGVSFVGGACMI